MTVHVLNVMNVRKAECLKDDNLSLSKVPKSHVVFPHCAGKFLAFYSIPALVVPTSSRGVRLAIIHLSN